MKVSRVRLTDGTCVSMLAVKLYEDMMLRLSAFG